MDNHSDSAPQPAEMFSVLAHERRVNLILILIVSGQSTVSVRYLAEMLAVLETQSLPRDLETNAYRLARQSLTKSHLETLEAADVIQQNGNSVAQGPRFSQYSRLAMTYFQLPSAGTTILD